MRILANFAKGKYNIMVIKKVLIFKRHILKYLQLKYHDVYHSLCKKYMRNKNVNVC